VISILIGGATPFVILIVAFAFGWIDVQ